MSSEATRITRALELLAAALRSGSQALSDAADRFAIRAGATRAQRMATIAAVGGQVLR